MSKFTSILIANRGEIACRVIRTAKALGYRTVAVYSDADATAPHVKMADESVHIGASPVNESYLVAEKILDAARSSGAEAIHPGYGFLSENADFAQACEDAGLVFIGPGVEAINVMGNKAESKRRMLAAEVPCVPGYQGVDQRDETLLLEADGIGLPLMVKAAAGGGGRGMRLVHSFNELANAIKLARAEAESAFGSGELILERAIIRPRHVEIQVFADMHGNTIHLGERDCSVQRRHQKVIEEAPCPIMTTELRDRMGRAAVDAARSVNYCGAGTVEFLLDENGEFYFLEMNTRLQVEHPVTEMITGLDLVELQIQVAQNQPLNLSQEDIILSGHAIEVRLYTEDPSQDFLPMAGSIKLWAPAQGVGVRIDSGISSDQDISPYYDPMVAKVIASGSTREEARTRLIKALKETVLFGVKNNKEFLVNCLEKDRFKAGLATTAFIAEEFGDTPIVDAVPSFSDCAVAALLSLELEYRLHCSRSVSAPPLLRSWASASPLVSRRQYGFDEVIHDLFVTAAGTNKYRVTNGELSVEIELLSMSAADAQVVIDGHMQLVHWQEPASGELHMSIEGRSAHYRDLICREGTVEETSAGDRITAPMHGLLLDILVKSGDSVGKGQTLAVLEAMKLHHEILATEAGTVTEVLAEPGTQVPADSLLITIDVNSTP